MSIRDPQITELARELALLRGTNMCEAIKFALIEKLKRPASDGGPRIQMADLWRE